jgi:hypothetical protein
MTPQKQHQQQAWILKPKKGWGGKKKTPTNPLKKKNKKKPRQTKNSIKNDMNNEVVDNNNDNNKNNSVNLRHNNQCCCVLQETLQRLRMTRLFWRLLKLIRWDLAYSFNQKRLCACVCMYMYVFVLLQSVHTLERKRDFCVHRVRTKPNPDWLCVECVIKETPHESPHLLSKFSL